MPEERESLDENQANALAVFNKIKDHVFNQSQTIDELKSNVIQDINKIKLKISEAIKKEDALLDKTQAILTSRNPRTSNQIMK